MIKGNLVAFFLFKTKKNKITKTHRYISNSKPDRNCQFEPNLSLLEPFV